MLKTKDDEFLGDNLTHNIQYADNVWQAHGTVDRGSVYTKEPLLDLLFEGYDYSKQIGDYAKYVARASTREASGTSNKDYVSARLQHDLYTVDSQYYTVSSIASSHNIFSLATYLEKAIALSNPVYDGQSVAKTINLLGIRRVANNNNANDFEWKNSNLKNVSLLEVLKPFVPDWHVDSSVSNATLVSKLGKYINRYLYSSTAVSIEGTGNKISYELIDSKYALPPTNLSLSQKLEDFILTLNNYTYEVTDDDDNIVATGNVADAFLRDFDLSFHNPDTIKLPFYGRGENVKGNNRPYKDEEDTKTFKTRFIVNSLSGNLYKNEQSVCRPVYLEKLDNIVEEAIFTDYRFYTGRAAADKSTANHEKFQTAIEANGEYEHLNPDADIATRTLLSSFVKTLDNLDSAISLYCPEVFTEYAESNSPEQSWGIHFINEESTENLFQDADRIYQLYNEVLVGYKLADTLIANRVGICGLYYIISQSEASSNYPISLDIPLQQRTVYSSFYDCSSSANNPRLHYYPTISAINSVYKLGNVPGTSKISLPEANKDAQYAYDLAPEIRAWLETECFIFKGNVYGDYVEELNFLQDLHPDAAVNFNSLRLKNTEIVHKRVQDSRYEVPYVEQTIPLINNTKDNPEDLGVHASDAFAAKGAGLGKEVDKDGNVTVNTIPPFLYDYDKGDQADYFDSGIDSRSKNSENNPQRVNSKNHAGTLTAEQRIISPTIDELWTFLKYLTESDGSSKDDINGKLPTFYGIKKGLVEGTIGKEPSKTIKRVVNPRVEEEDTKEAVIDILNWEPVSKMESLLHWSPDADKDRVELQFKGYKITNYIEKVYDYEVKPFSRRVSDVTDNATYEYDTESTATGLTGYLEKLYNSAILAFDLPDVDTTDKLKTSATTALLFANVLDSSYSAIDNPATQEVEAVQIFTKDVDNKLVSTNKPIHGTEQRKKAFEALSKILSYKDGESLHNHYKHYLENPKNLKEIERDLETIRQNLQTLAEFSVASFASLGYADRAQNRGTLHQLHKNAYDYLSTFICSVNNTIANGVDETGKSIVKLDPLDTDLNNTVDDLTITVSDRRVVFDDGDYNSRYLKENYDASVINLNGDLERHTRARHERYRPNETLLSEVYLAADGTWRSVHEHTVLPVLFSDH